MARRRRRLLKIALSVVAFLLILLVYAAWPGRWTYTVSPETTYVTGPLDKQGHIDYPAALHERLSQGITPENNANVLIWKAVGPHPERNLTMPAEYFQWLGYEPPEQGEYWISFQKYLRDIAKIDGADTRLKLNERMERMAKRPWKAENEPEIAGWLKHNEKPLALVIEASRRTQYYNPHVPQRTEDWSQGLLKALLGNLQSCRELAAALVWRAMLRNGMGARDEAWQDLLACHRLGCLIGRAGGLMELLVGLAINVNACKADVEFLDQAKLTSKQALACQRDLQALLPMSAVGDIMDLDARLVFLDTVTQVARHGMKFLDGTSESNWPPPNDSEFMSQMFRPSVDFNPALRTANAYYDRSMAIVRITDRALRQQEFDALVQDLRALKSGELGRPSARDLLLKPEARGQVYGNVMVGLMLPAFDKVQSAVERGDQWQRNLHLAFALAAYRADHGRYPATLAELAPKYLEKVPDDLFSGQALIYRLEEKGYLLYSVGPSGMNDGSGDEDLPKGDDITIRVPVAGK